MRAPKRRTQPLGGAASVGSSAGTISHQRSLFPNTPGGISSRQLRCWRCEQNTSMVLAGRPTCWACRYVDDARPDDHGTSLAAAASTERGAKSRLAQAILARLRRHGPHTDDELHQAFPDELLGSISKRRGDLVAAGLVANTGATRPTRRNRPAIVWEVTP